MFVTAFFRLDGIPQHARHVALDVLAVEVGQHDPRRRKDGHVAVAEKVDIARVMQDSRNVRGYEVFALAQPHDGGRSVARNDDLVRLVGRDHAHGEGAPEVPHGAAHPIFER